MIGTCIRMSSSRSLLQLNLRSADRRQTVRWRMNVLKTVIALATAGVLLGGCEAPGTQGAPRSAEPFTQMYFSPTVGRVGYHFETHFHVPQHDLPAGYVSGQCNNNHTSNSFEGTLPPGVDYRTTGASMFTGTPRQAGSWTIIVHIRGPHCTTGHNTSIYPDRRILLTIRIDP